MKSYLAIDNYIHNFYNNNHKKISLQGSSQYKEWSKLWYGYPGRIDLFGFKDGNYYCFEVKVNTSRLSRWQIIRLHWMKEQGYNSHILSVSLTNRYKKELVDLYHQSNIADIIESLNPRCDMKEFKLSDYQNSYEFVPSNEEVEYYSKIDYQWIAYKVELQIRQIDNEE